VKLGVSLGWHSLSFEALLEAVRLAEELGYAIAFVDGDVSMVPSRGKHDVLDGLTVTTELLALTTRIEVSSIRLVHFWNAARLAQTLATQARLHPGRVRLFISIGGRPEDARFGLPVPPVRERIRWLDETLEAVRALWREESVSCQGHHVHLDRAQVRPVPPGEIPIHVAGRGARLLELVARHADAWDINLPPLRSRVKRAEEQLAAACRVHERDPGGIGRSLWIFTRPGRDPDDPGLAADFQRLNPWFGDLTPRERGEAMVAGPPGACIARIASMARDLDLDLPVLDLSGLERGAALRALEALGPAKTLVDSSS
jgi:alkanesulfonate monooxygenase SsuD/methylene tetrahydromethanopterin reductase-like flavin-dependent oxidoreductase (luciferase family)